MTTWNGQPVGALVKIDPNTGELWPGFNTHVYGGTNVIRDMQLEDDGLLYLAGAFTTVSESGVIQSKSGAVRLDPITGAVDAGWAPQITSGAAWGISRSKTRDVTYIAGHFNFVNSLSGTAGFVSVDDTGAVVDKRDAVPFNGCYAFGGYCTQMYDVVATAQGDVWVGGVEHSLYVLDESADLAMKWHHYSGCDPTKNEECLPAAWYGGEFQEIEAIGDRVYATCHCWFDLYSTQNQVLEHANRTLWDGVEGVDYFWNTINAVAAFDATTGAVIPEFQPLLGGDSGGFGVHLNESDGCLWIAGGIDSYGPPGGVQPLAHNVVRLCDELGPGIPAGPPATPPTPLACTASNNETAVAIDFTLPEGAVRSVVYRSVNGASFYWRGALDVPAASFNESIPAGSVVQYQVRAKYEADQLSAPLDCDPVIDLSSSLQPVPECSTQLSPTNQPIVTWAPANDATSYVVSRTVNGGPRYWRAKVTDGSNVLTDAVAPFSVTFTYDVVSKDITGAAASPTVCTPDVVAIPAAVQPVPSCSSVIDASNFAQLTWEAAPNATEYIIYRSVNGGPRYWRAKVNTTNFTSTSVLEIGKTYVYDVVAGGAGGTRATQTPCDPQLQIDPPALTPPTSCQASVDAAGVVILNWAGGQNAVKYVVRRQANGSPFYWRGAVTDGSDTFTDSITDNRTYLYRVDAVGAGGAVAEPTICAWI